MPINTPEPQQKLTSIFRDVFDDDSIVLRDDMTAADIANWDSITHVNLIVAVEKEFKVRFTTAEVTSLANVGELVAHIQRKAALCR